MSTVFFQASLAAMGLWLTGTAMAERMPRIGVAFNSPVMAELESRPPTAKAAVELVEGLASYGWIDGKNVQIVWKSAREDPARIPVIIDELVRERVDVIVTSGNAIAAEAAHRTAVIPIVMGSSMLPVEDGLVRRLARPGANVTGLTSEANPQLKGKRLELLKTLDPRVRRVGFLVPATVDEISPWTKEAAGALGLDVVLIRVRGAADVDAALARASAMGVNGLVVPATPFTYVLRNFEAIRDAAQRHRLPAIYGTKGASEHGGLMAYANDEWAQFRRAAFFVDRILRGAKPSDLPVEQPARMHLEVNLTTAKELGLEVPPSVLAQADLIVR
ncbi:MAG TPA: ABC transporter substrate-binding protein [Usitatibacter sp.]|nr:ABC transporter substrate-binding protein [Usitatibacter sp.]